MFQAVGALILTEVSSIAMTAGGCSSLMNRGRGLLITTAAGPEYGADAAGLGYPGRFGPGRGFPGGRSKVNRAPSLAGRLCRPKLDASSGSGSAHGLITNMISGRITIPSLTSAILAPILTCGAGSFTTAGKTSQLLTGRLTSPTSPTIGPSLMPVAPIFSA